MLVLASLFRWKGCATSTAGSFSAAIGKLYVQQHFDPDAKKAMLEMVKDLKKEFKLILDEVILSAAIS